MSRVGSMVATLGLLAFTAVLADEPPKAPSSAAKADKSDCVYLPIPGSHIKAHVCDPVDHYRYLRDRDGLLALSAPAASTTLPAPGGSTTTPIQ
jgi:hypothetical protein